MANFICESHIWSSSDGFLIPDNNSAHYKYYLKKHTKTTYSDEKIAYAESRDVLCKPKNKFRDNLSLEIQNIDNLLYEKQVSKIQWIAQDFLVLLFSDGLILQFNVNCFTGDILHVHKDSSLVKETNLITSAGICDALLTENYFVASYNDLNELTMWKFTTPRFHGDKYESTAFIKNEKGKMFSTKFTGPNGGFPKHLSLNSSKTMVLLWFAASSAPHNLFVYFPGEEGLMLVTSMLISGVLRNVKFSALNSDTILSVTSSTSTSSVNRLNFHKGQMNIAFSADIPVRGQVVASDWSAHENRTALATEGGELFVVCSLTKVTRTTKLSIMPLKLIWMPSNCCIMVVGKFGEIQFFDSALNSLKSLVGGCLRDGFFLSEAFDGQSLEVVAIDTNMYCGKRESRMNECLLISTRGGPLVMITIGLGVANSEKGINSITIFNQLLGNGKIFEAHELLQSLDWSFEMSDCIFCLASFINYLLRQPPSDDIINYIQSALRKFYASTNHGSEVVAMEYGESVTNLARRYFKLLMRLKLYEKCYLIARDIQHKDLFMELYYAARDINETSLAECSRRAAMNLEEEMLECEFLQDDRDSVQSLNSLDSLYSSPHLSEEEVESEIKDTLQVHNREVISQLMRETETMAMAELNDEFTQYIK